MGLIRLLLILGLVYFGLRILMRMVLPFLLKLFAKKVQKKMADQMNQQQGRPSGFQQEGNVYVKPPVHKKEKSIKNFEGGEYIDFEEVDEK